MATMFDYRIQELYLSGKYSGKYINDLTTEVMAEYEAEISASNNKEELVYQLVIEKLGLHKGNVGSSNKTIDTAEIDNDIDAESKKKGRDVILVTHPNIFKTHGNEEFATYGRMQMVSHFEGITQQDWNNYIAKRGYVKSIINLMKDIQKDYPNEEILADRTIKSHTRKLKNSDKPMIKSEEKNGKSYYKLLNSIDGKYYIRIPYQQMRELVIVTNGSMLRLYTLVCSILRAKKCGYDKYHPITRSYLAECLGYSTDTDDAAKAIGTMLTALCKLGHLERIETTEIDKENNTYKSKYSYRRTTLEEWQEANKRGTIKNNI